MMRAIILFFVLGLCSCRVTSATHIISNPIFEGICVVIDEAYSPKVNPISFTLNQEDYLHSIKIMDPVALLAHPRYFDRIKSIQNRTVERFYLNHNGVVFKSALVVLSENEFFLPIKLMAKYYDKHGFFPNEKSITTGYLAALISANK